MGTIIFLPNPRCEDANSAREYINNAEYRRNNPSCWRYADASQLVWKPTDRKWEIHTVSYDDGVQYYDFTLRAYATVIFVGVLPLRAFQAYKDIFRDRTGGGGGPWTVLTNSTIVARTVDAERHRLGTAAAQLKMIFDPAKSLATLAQDAYRGPTW